MLNLFYFFIYCCQHHERKTNCLDIFLLSDREWGTAHQYWLSRFLGVSILQLLIIYRIYCHSNSVNTGSSLPNISDVKTRKRRNMIRNRYIKRGDSSMVKEIRKDKGCSMKLRDARNTHATELNIIPSL